MKTIRGLVPSKKLGESQITSNTFFKLTVPILLCTALTPETPTQQLHELVSCAMPLLVAK